MCRTGEDMKTAPQLQQSTIGRDHKGTDPFPEE